MIEHVTATDKLKAIRRWLEYMEDVDSIDSYTYGETQEVDNVYEVVKDNTY